MNLNQTNFKVGDIVKLNGNPFDEQLLENIKYYFLKNKKHIVTEVKRVSKKEGASGQWIKTNLMNDDWTDKAWFKLVKK